MNKTVALTVIRQTFATADKLGATIPKAVATERARLVKLLETATAQTLTHDVPGAVVASLAAGKDPETDPAVALQLTRQALAGVAGGVDAAIYERAGDSLTAHAGALLESFRKPFDAATATLVAAHEVVGDIDLNDTRGILKRGGKAAEQWGRAQTAERVIEDIRQAWKLLATADPQLAIDKRFALLAIADVPPAAFIDEQLTGSTMRAWDAVRHGFPLSLATPELLAQRIAGIYGEYEQRAQRDAIAGRAAIRQRYGMGVGVPSVA